MSTLDKILKLLKEKNLKQKDLTDYLGISKNAFTDWKSGRINSYLKHLPKIAEFLGCSVDYLLTENDNAISFSKFEEKIILAYRQHPEHQASINALLGLSAYDCEDNKEKGAENKKSAASTIAEEIAEELLKPINTK